MRESKRVKEVGAMELMSIIVFCIVVGFLIKKLGKALMNIGIGICIVIVVGCLLSGLSIFDFFQ